MKLTENKYDMEVIDPPMNLQLRSNMGGCKINYNEYFLAGGMCFYQYHVNNFVFRDACIYNAKSNSIEILPKMNDKRFNFPTEILRAAHVKINPF